MDRATHQKQDSLDDAFVSNYHLYDGSGDCGKYSRVCILKHQGRLKNTCCKVKDLTAGSKPLNRRNRLSLVVVCLSITSLPLAIKWAMVKQQLRR